MRFPPFPSVATEVLTLRFGCCRQSSLFMSLSLGESPAPGQDQVCPAPPAGMLHARMGKGNNDILSHTTGPGSASLAQSPFPLLVAASVAAAEEPQGVPVFIPYS